VVDYEDFFQGIVSISLSDSEACAEIALPGHDICVIEGRHINAVTADSFVQVAGLLANSSNEIDQGEVLLAASFDKVEVLLPPNTSSIKEWKVFAQISPATDRKVQYVGDVYAFTKDDHLAAVFEGCRFEKTSIERLKKVLGGAMPAQAQPTRAVKTANQPVATSNAMPMTATKLPNSFQQTTLAAPADCSNRMSLLKQILMTHLGLSATEFDNLDPSCALSSLGLDSLASVEIAGELPACGIQINGPSLMDQSIGDLKETISRESSNRPASLVSDITQSSSALLASNMVTTSNATSDTPKGSELDLHNAKGTLRSLISTVLGVEPDPITNDAELQQLGVDSLCLIELKAEFSTALSVQLGDDEVTCESTISTIIAAAGVSGGSGQDTSSTSETGTPNSLSAAWSRSSFDGIDDLSDRMNLDDMKKAVEVTDQNFDTAAQQHGFSNYWSDVVPTLNNLLVKYIAEAFQSLGIDLTQLAKGSPVSMLTHLPKHSQVVQRYYDILQQHSVLTREESAWFRGSARISNESVADLHATALRHHPQYRIDIELMAVTGTKLAECLTGKQNPVALLFGNPKARDLLNKFYRVSPMLNTLTEQLLLLIEKLVKSDNGMRRLRILEVGGGTGGTTSRLAPLLQSVAPPEQYTFTDISSTLTRQAVKEFGQFTWMDYRIFNLEEDVPTSMKGNYDIAIATNCVHATKSRTESLRKIYEALSDDGIVILSEQTRTIDWYDIVFGLLDGWWYSDGGSGYPIRTALQWKDDFKHAGFSDYAHTGGPSLESNSQQLLVGMKPEMTRKWEMPGTDETKLQRGLYGCQTFEYKQVDGAHLQADVFLPRQSPSTPMARCRYVRQLTPPNSVNTSLLTVFNRSVDPWRRLHGPFQKINPLVPGDASNRQWDSACEHRLSPLSRG
jgi:acyl carrier protein/SAM-dependent methyltransferase